MTRTACLVGVRTAASIVMAFAALATMASATAAAEEGPRIGLVVDASNSMRAEMTGGVARIDGAKTAALAFLSGLRPETVVSVWAYGHRSPTEKRDCEDIEEIALSAPVASGRAAAGDAVSRLEPRGYTPISGALTRVAKSFGTAAAGGRTIVLVSDGKETCAGDPCAVAQALARADAALVVHVVGLGVDAATRGQLQCIAERGRGSYFDAGNVAELTAALAAAARTRPPAEPVRAVETPAPGRLTIKRSAGHRVHESESDREAGWVPDGGDTSVDLPAGIYNVKFPMGALWRGVQIRPGKTTVLAPGVLKVSPPLNNHRIRDTETGEELGFLPERAERQAVLIPGIYTIGFGFREAIKVTVDVAPDAVTEYKAGAIRADGVGTGSWPIVSETGQELDTLMSSHPVVVLPPGRYLVRTTGGEVTVSLGAGEIVAVGRR